MHSLFWTWVLLPLILNLAFYFAIEPVLDWIVDAVRRMRRAAAARSARKD